MQIPSVSYGGPIIRGANNYARENRGVSLAGGSGGIDISSEGGGGGHPAFHTGPWDMEHHYSEIPPPSSMELHQHEPFHIQDLKGMDYHSSPGQYDYNNEPSMGPPPPPLSSSSGLHNNRQSSYGAAFNSSGTNKDTLNLSKQGVVHHQDIEPKHKDKMDDLDLDIYPRLKSPLCVCTKQVTMHVLIMVLAGIVYLTIGGIAGFYIGKSCK